MHLPLELVGDVAVCVFAATGSLRRLSAMARTCKAWHAIIMRDSDVMCAIARMRGWRATGASWLDTVQSHMLPLLRWDQMLRMDTEYSKLHVDSYGRIFAFAYETGELVRLGSTELRTTLPMVGVQPRSLLWMDSVAGSPWLLCIFLGEQGVHVFEKATLRAHSVRFIEDARWYWVPQLSSGGWLYRDSGAGVRRVHCADAGIAAPNDDAWAPVCTFEQGPLCVGRCDGQDAVVLANTHSVAVVRDGVVSAPLNRKLHNRLPDEVHAFVEGGRARVVVGCYGGVSLFEDQTLNRPTKERVLVGQTDRAQCYLMRGRGAMVAMALQQDWDENEHTVMVLDLVSGWTRCVRARGHINDMAWTPDGKLVALCSKAVFVVGGPPMAL